MINDYYKDQKLIQVIKKKLKDDKVVELQQFLKSDVAKKIALKISKLKFLKEEKLMSHSYYYSTDEKILSEVMNELLPFLIDVIEINNLDVSIVKLQHKDHLLIHEDKHKLFALELTTEWSDECGGNMFFTDGKGLTKKINTQFNSLILSNGNLRFFIKYVNNNAKKNSKYLIIGRFK